MNFWEIKNRPQAVVENALWILLKLYKRNGC